MRPTEEYIHFSYIYNLQLYFLCRYVISQTFKNIMKPILLYLYILCKFLKGRSHYYHLVIPNSSPHF